eukprot:289382-Chlamydomonas_euryale.AAC.4
MSVVETVEPVLEQEPQDGAGSSVASPAGGAGQARGVIYNVEVGRLLDEFFEFAHELERNLSTSGTVKRVGLRRDVHRGRRAAVTVVSCAAEGLPCSCATLTTCGSQARRFPESMRSRGIGKPETKQLFWSDSSDAPSPRSQQVRKRNG